MVCLFNFPLTKTASATTLEEYESQFSRLRDCMYTIEMGVLINGLKMEFEVDGDYYSEENQRLYHRNIVNVVSGFHESMVEFPPREARYHIEKWLEDKSIALELMSMSLSELDSEIRRCNSDYL